ncbi:hypothetical protein AGNV_090 [Anticarsia gemmatalis nucleopolyhedrovirus]|uniref:Uncharacterized protein n=1 Tax=Anticarsia gemmatalis multiple nucleopolyhedrovirus TaxID=268591 RepID=A0A0S3IZM6_9ABAC|nr:hypothetical protein AGNV_090 [Anticarsia gemmatalis nucleopolyhedrovirus]ABI13855.1 hypothetical protein AGNV_090 [Anticarsia gemmatalis multiple nucleopolyhedrovirus]ALR70210.1 hypothetical protein AGNV_090 [Anticarsia gemmatalis multiple nucleopolyhedrovirus]ALR70523.1 hypothetical protein AGNV_090 [Anticarsia gemmatalis multiple nucleopolyhedrovirus]ALR70995.1 hypothetical protein AGNV_090 [Anticarsia gemmatalis multiple nucleopolyhedrovirus]ALR71468.1 hypothetical protein AGNV_090 [Ant
MTTPQATLNVVQEDALAKVHEIQALLSDSNATLDALSTMETDLYNLLAVANVLQFDPQQENLNPLKQNIRHCLIIFIDLITIKKYIIYNFV